MEYLKDEFSLQYGTKEYRDGYERTFGEIEICPKCDYVMTYGGLVSGHQMYRCEQCGEARYIMLD